jgi:lysophospholipase L1-like esterase
VAASPKPMNPETPMWRKALEGLGLAFFVIAALEGILRVVGVSHPVRPRIILRLLDTDVTLPYMREDFDVFWSPTPGFQGVFMGKTIRVNNLGMRGADVAIPKPPGRKRVVCFGDSITFGYGVNDNETYPVRLGEALEDPSLEVLNAGVTGYSSHQVVGLARRFLPALTPDVATVLVGWNDGNHRPVEDREYSRRIAMVQGAEQWLDHVFIYRALKNLYLRSAALQGLSRARGSPKMHRVSVPRYEENLGAFVSECRARGVKPVLISLPHQQKRGEPSPDTVYPDALEETARKLNVPLLSVGELAAGGPATENERFFLDPLHLTPEGNRLLAQILARQLRDRSLL